MVEIHRLHLADISPAAHLPWTRPTFPVLAYLVLHPAGPILIDSGVGVGNPHIDELYSPLHRDLDEELGVHGIGVDDIETVITSHLHFDHCGQNHRFPRSRVFVQQAEVEAAKAPLYTVSEWAFPPNVNLTVIDGDHDVAAGIRVIATPGHTPGHQSVAIDEADRLLTVVCCQASWSATSFGAVSLGDDGWDDATGMASVQKLHDLRPHQVLFSHDTHAWRPR
ncbi:MAG: MBL fold metallo-hydrolase [Actinomycetota bacterium]|nr:MBL fold metallo-hydrolase [Actinomycetota bacterium]